MKRTLPLLLSLAVTLAASAAPAPTLKAGEFSPARDAPEIALRGSHGAELKLRHFRGKVVLMAFGFTHCPEVCPVTLATLAQARKRLGAAAADVQVVYVTVDPERDTTERMRTYLAGFDPAFVGGTGAPAQLEAVRKDYGIAARKVAMSGGYAIDHSSSIYLIDREGKLRAMMPYGHEADDFVHDVKVLLKK